MSLSENQKSSSMLEKRVRGLENELFAAREAILSLMPAPLQAALTGFYTVESRDEAHQWREEVVQIIIDHAKPLPNITVSFGKRAMCPLCGEGSPRPNDDGFLLPDGLRRHIFGLGNGRQCVVSKAAFALAKDHWATRFRSAVDERLTSSVETVQFRRGLETLYRMAPNGPALLMEEGLSTFRGLRDATSLAWAEVRLTELGFSVTVQNRVKTYTREYPEWSIFADPREKGEIVFRVFGKSVGVDGIAKFTLPDRWKHDLNKKFGAAVAAAVARP
ncbi:hypothetical protein [Paraburkholderia sp. C35]|uniref:hypothetical protein n=1 Tax=Paraburkholderia sp. C35 TaxID=2126993 RepID=UPI000D68D3B3|nr:hypothetical protein [Paraburkholderia sp. C35]